MQFKNRYFFKITKTENITNCLDFFTQMMQKSDKFLQKITFLFVSLIAPNSRGVAFIFPYMKTVIWDSGSGGGSLLCFTCRFAENDPQKSWSGSNKSREVYFYGKKDFMKKNPRNIFSAFQKVGGGENRISKRLKWWTGPKMEGFWAVFLRYSFQKQHF